MGSVARHSIASRGLLPLVLGILQVGVGTSGSMPLETTACLGERNPVRSPRTSLRRVRDLPARGRNDRSGAAGFTLIEMLVTLAIIGIVSALALSGMSGFSAGRRLAFTSDVVAAEIDRLRVEALRTGQRGGLIFEPGSERFLSSRLGASPISTRGSRVTVETRPGGRAGPGEIWLLANGSSTGGRIVLAAQGTGVVLTVSALTGLVRREDIP